MKNLKRILISTVLLALPLSALADDDRDYKRHHHKHYHYKHEQPKHHYHKHHYHKHHHHYHETRGDRGQRPHFRHHEQHVYHHHHYRHYERPVRHERVYVPAVVHPPVVYPQGVTIHGNVHFPF